MREQQLFFPPSSFKLIMVPTALAAVKGSGSILYTKFWLTFK